MNSFPTDIDLILERVSTVNPVAYAETRNYLDGRVTRLSPYLTHGVISTREVGASALSRFTFDESYKLMYELMWREFFHRVWQEKGTDIFSDLRGSQQVREAVGIPRSVKDGKTGIAVIDKGVSDLCETGYIHNHVRMWIAFLVANLASCRWSEGARWMYYHLLDGDLASNTLGWQWIAGTASHRKYLANQENLDRYSRTSQRGTFLDRSYEDLSRLEVPEVLQESTSPHLETVLPLSELHLPSSDRLLLYHPWSLDPRWRKAENWDRVLVLEPSHFQKFPVSEKRMAFILRLAREVPNISIFSGEVCDFPYLQQYSEVRTKEYPACIHYPGERDERDWIVGTIKKLPQGFTKFWKLHEAEIRSWKPDL